MFLNIFSQSLLIGVFSICTFNEITDNAGFMTAILLFVLYISYVFLSVSLLLPSFVLYIFYCSILISLFLLLYFKE